MRLGLLAIVAAIAALSEVASAQNKPIDKSLDAIDFLVDGRDLMGKRVTVTGCSFWNADSFAVSCRAPKGAGTIDIESETMNRESLRRALKTCKTVVKLSSNNEGKGVLVVDMSKISTVKTWNNAFSDIGDRALITPGTPLHHEAMELSLKQNVIFSGTFFPSSKDCIKESSITQRGSMTNPDWIFRFSAIRPGS